MHRSISSGYQEIKQETRVDVATWTPSMKQLRIAACAEDAESRALQAASAL